MRSREGSREGTVGGGRSSSTSTVSLKYDNEGNFWGFRFSFSYSILTRIAESSLVGGCPGGGNHRGGGLVAGFRGTSSLTLGR